MPSHYITTAIDYPNAAPHMGHVLEKVLADVLARWGRLCGEDVRFQIGTDEHGIKIQQTAKKEGMEPKPFVERNRQLFIDLYSRLQISYDEPFMHTSGNPEHTKTVQELWKRLAKAKHEDGSPVLEKRDYTALYCSGCERFITKKELVDGKCPDHGIAPQEVTEQNWFFTLSKDTEYLKNLLKSKYIITPDFRAPETLTLLEQGLEDVSFSRPKSSLSWGIPVPGDEEQTMYVWCDALTNYISGIRYFDDETSAKKWWGESEVVHVIGKDIARFHALIWPAMLHHAGVPAPKRLLIHGFLTSEGQKMSKSLGNVVIPQEVIDKYGIDALRFYLSHEIPVGNDGDFSWKRFGELYDSKLRNQLGNLLNRVLVLLGKDEGAVSLNYSFEDSAEELENLARYKRLELLTKENFTSPGSAWDHINGFFEVFSPHNALQIIMKLVSEANQLMDEQKPWAVQEQKNRIFVLSVLAEMLRHISLMLLPFIPDTAQKISVQLGVPYAGKMLEKKFEITKKMKQWGSQKEWKQIGTPSILFPPIV